MKRIIIALAALFIIAIPGYKRLNANVIYNINPCKKEAIHSAWHGTTSPGYKQSNPSMEIIRGVVDKHRASCAPVLFKGRHAADLQYFLSEVYKNYTVFKDKINLTILKTRK